MNLVSLCIVCFSRFLMYIISLAKKNGLSYLNKKSAGWLYQQIWNMNILFNSIQTTPPQPRRNDFKQATVGLVLQGAGRSVSGPHGLTNTSYSVPERNEARSLTVALIKSKKKAIKSQISLCGQDDHSHSNHWVFLLSLKLQIIKECIHKC